MPVHGEWRHLRANKELAISTGVNPENIPLAQNGVVVDLVDGQARVVGQFPVGNLYVDGVRMGDIDDEVLEDRTAMADGGLIAVSVVIDNRSGRPLESPQIQAKGFSDDARDMLTELREHDAILLGAIGDPSVPSGILERGLLLRLRFELDHHVNLRPARLYPGVRGPLSAQPEVDLVVVREGTEGPYAGTGGLLRKDTPQEIATEVSINTAFGVASVRREWLNVARTLEVGPLRRAFTIILPAAAPTILTGMRISIGIAWLVIVAAEMVVGGTGIGYFVWNEWNNLSLTNVIFAILVIGVVGMALDALFARAQRAVTYVD